MDLVDLAHIDEDKNSDGTTWRTSRRIHEHGRLLDGVSRYGISSEISRDCPYV